MFNQLIEELNSLKNPSKAKILQGFFKTWPWFYGEGDVFLWITVPVLRILSKKYKSLEKSNLEVLLKSKIHEHRFLALAIIRLNFEFVRDKEIRKEWYEFSLKNITSINNWDLVDTFAPYVIWTYLEDKDRSILYTLVNSSNLWERRIAIISTFDYIRMWQFEDTIKICEILMQDKHDLIQKATWWMLREVGKKDIEVLFNFLDKYYKIMPRTMLRYAIERFDKEKKEYYMKRK